MNLYLEGGRHLRKPMNSFIRRAIGHRFNLRVIPCGSRSVAIDRFAREARASSSSILLIDSEGEDLIRLARELSRQTGVSESARRIFFMVELMEAWFLADRNALRGYFGQGFRPNRLSGNPNVERIPKQDVLNGLINATRGSRVGAYNKGKHAARLLDRLDPDAVYRSCPNFRRLIDHLR